MIPTRGWIISVTKLPQNLAYNSGQFAINGLPVDEGGSGIASAEYVLGGNVPDQVWDVTNPLKWKE